MRSPFASRKWQLLLVLWVLELLLVFLAVRVAAWLRFLHDPDTHAAFVHDEPLRGLIVAAFVTFAMAAFGLYQAYVRYQRHDLVLRLVLSFVFGGIGLLVLYYLVPQVYIGRGILAMALPLALLAVLGSRKLAQQLFRGEGFKRRILVLGAGNNAALIHAALHAHPSLLMVGFLPLPSQPIKVPDELLVHPVCSLAEFGRRLRVHEIVSAPDERRGGLPMEEMLACAQAGIIVTDLSSFLEREIGMVEVAAVDPSWLLFSGGFDHSLPRRLSKRFFDLVAASTLLLVAWPLMLGVALGIWLESGTPVLFRQSRVGEGGRVFDLLKFRSMRLDAESDGVARWARQGDDRVTRFGRFIRLTRLDELPQLFNVLRGQMSLVGPRPERPFFVDQLSSSIRYYPVRHCVKPGLTGWAQLRYPYGASVEDAREKLKFDLFYAKNHNLLFDLVILVQTLEVVVFRHGAR
jgi:sugar transferase (PEP-CTERM system associated)